jgi:RNA polymerase sigma-70 factor (ECF subfamily)
MAKDDSMDGQALFGRVERQATVDINAERALISAAQHGDEQAVGRLYDAYVDHIHRYLFYRVHDAQVAEDLTADVFLRMVEGLPGYQDRCLPFLAWLYRIAQARLVDYYRRAKRAGEQQDFQSADLRIEEDFDSDLLATYQHQKLHDALNTLTADQQQVIVLRFIEAYDLQKTAEAMGKTVGAVKVMQHRALQALGRALEKHGVSEQTWADSLPSGSGLR